MSQNGECNISSPGTAPSLLLPNFSSPPFLVTAKPFVQPSDNLNSCLPPQTQPYGMSSYVECTPNTSRGEQQSIFNTVEPNFQSFVPICSSAALLENSITARMTVPSMNHDSSVAYSPFYYPAPSSNPMEYPTEGIFSGKSVESSFYFPPVNLSLNPANDTASATNALDSIPACVSSLITPLIDADISPATSSSLSPEFVSKSNSLTNDNEPNCVRLPIGSSIFVDAKDGTGSLGNAARNGINQPTVQLGGKCAVENSDSVIRASQDSAFSVELSNHENTLFTSSFKEVN